MRPNPIGTNGFAFVEFASSDPGKLADLFTKFGLQPAATHNSKPVTLFIQNEIVFIINSTENSHASSFSTKHGPCACGMGFLVQNAKEAFDKATAAGAKPYDGPTDHIGTAVPAIYGIGDSILYFIEEQPDFGMYQDSFSWSVDPKIGIPGDLSFIDHLTHNVYRGNMDTWANFYIDIFNFEQIRYFDIQGKHTGLVSRAMGSPDGKIKIPLNESKDEVSQIAEYLVQYKGEGIQHIAMHTDNIYEVIERMRADGVNFMSTPDTYFELVPQRLPDHGEDLARMQKNKILIDGGEEQGGGLLLQIFTNTCIGPIFFEIIQRKGNQGFGEGNFQALFDSIELDQIRRGVIKGSE